MKYRLLVDLNTDRIIWYTTDLLSNLKNDDHSAIATFDGNLPNGMNHGNCWTYGFRDKQIIQLDKKSTEKSLLETNRESIEKWLIGQINSKRSKISYDLRYDDYIQLQMYNEALTYKQENLENCRWIQMLMRLKSMPADQVVNLILTEYSEKQQILIQTETLKLEMINRINNAETNDELFLIRKETLEKLEKI